MPAVADATASHCIFGVTSIFLPNRRGKNLVLAIGIGGRITATVRNIANTESRTNVGARHKNDVIDVVTRISQNRRTYPVIDRVNGRIG